MSGVILYRTADGMVLCSTHAMETIPDGSVAKVLKPPQERSPRGDVVPRIEELTYMDGCLLCQTLPVLGNTCASCGKPLHPNWPAVYCSNRCALDDL